MPNDKLGLTKSYEWHLTGVYADLQGGAAQYLVDTGLLALRAAIGGGGSYFTANGNNALTMGAGGGLASQTAALTLNIALSGSACSGFQSGLPGGYGTAVLCNFVAGDTFQNAGTQITAATAAALNGQTVSDVLAAVNAYLGGNGLVPIPYSIDDTGPLNELVSNLNITFHEGTSGCDMSALAENHLCSA